MKQMKLDGCTTQIHRCHMRRHWKSHGRLAELLKVLLLATAHLSHPRLVDAIALNQLPSRQNGDNNSILSLQSLFVILIVEKFKYPSNSSYLVQLNMAEENEIIDRDEEQYYEPSDDSSDEQNAAEINNNNRRVSRLLTSKVREWMFFSVTQARAELEHGPSTDSITRRVVERARSLFNRMRDQHRCGHMPALSSFWKVWKDFWAIDKTISAEKQTRDRRPVGIVLIIESILRHHPGISHRKVHEFLPRDESTGRKIASESLVFDIMKKQLHLYFYRRRKVQLLTDADCIARFEFCRQVRQLLQSRQMPLDFLIVSDEMMIGLNRHFNRQNDGQWYVKGRQDHMAQLVTRKSFDNLVHVWVGLNWHIGVIGPFFVDEINVEGLTEKEKGKRPNSLTGAKYTRLLRDSIMPAIYAKMSEAEVRESFWWQQDGAGVHCSPQPLQYLHSIFTEDRILSRRSRRAWPARSPDLNPLDYSFWSLLRKEVSEVNPTNIREIKKALYDGCMLLEGKVQRIIADLPVRLRACFENQGHQFEPWLRQYKNRVAKNGVCPRCANQANNDVLCNDCNRILFEVIIRDRERDVEQILREQGDQDDDDDDILEEIGENLGAADE